MKSMLFICRRAPYGDSLAKEALDMALAAAAFSQPVSMLFADDGVYQLLAGQDSAAIARKPIDALVRAMPLYEIENIMVDRGSLERRGIAPEALVEGTRLFDGAGFAALCREYDVVLNF